MRRKAWTHGTKGRESLTALDKFCQRATMTIWLLPVRSRLTKITSDIILHTKLRASKLMEISNIPFTDRSLWKRTTATSTTKIKRVLTYKLTWTSLSTELKRNLLLNLSTRALTSWKAVRPKPLNKCSSPAMILLLTILLSKDTTRLLKLLLRTSTGLSLDYLPTVRPETLKRLPK